MGRSYSGMFIPPMPSIMLPKRLPDDCVGAALLDL